jgi:hypothetical protein
MKRNCSRLSRVAVAYSRLRIFEPQMDADKRGLGFLSQRSSAVIIFSSFFDRSVVHHHTDLSRVTLEGVEECSDCASCCFGRFQMWHVADSGDAYPLGVRHGLLHALSDGSVFTVLFATEQ